ncbi:MAG: cytochrome C [Rhodobacteraceae bacterium]|nr:cytochrome C [Paracoccaceae bacterium]
MKTLLSSFAIAAVTASPSFAGGHTSGDAAAGESAFGQCQACHVVRDADGNVLAGRGRSAPNLYGTGGGAAAVDPDFRYSKSLAEAGEKGLEWTEENFVAYVMDPTGFLREYLGDSGARAKMAFRVRSEEDALNLYAYIASLSPAE